VQNSISYKMHSAVRFRRATLAIAIIACGAALNTSAQESSSRPEDASQPTKDLPTGPAPKGGPGTPAPVVVAAGSPAAALRDTLIAACAQDSTAFARFLTARSKASFEHLTPSARVALMKRFVLLSIPGRASEVANPSGRPIVRCETPDVTTEMSIGGVDLQENLAFMPLELRDATDAVGANIRQINMGLVRERGQWRLLSLGVLLLDLPALEVEWDAAEAGANEDTAIANVKKLADSVEAYRRTYVRLPESLVLLGPPQKIAATATHPEKTPAPSRDHAGLLDEEFAAGKKDGYEFRIVIATADATGAPAKYQLSATPTDYGRTGRRSFFLDTEGVWHAADHGGAVGSGSDPKLN
jgi:hypothetical protein